MTSTHGTTSFPASTPAPASAYTTSSRLTAIQLFLRAGHWFGSIALFLSLAVWVLAYRKEDYHWPVALAFAASDLGMCSALFAALLARRAGRTSSEISGTIFFNLVLMALAFQMMLLNHLDVIRTAIDKFFSPT